MSEMNGLCTVCGENEIYDHDDGTCEFCSKNFPVQEKRVKAVNQTQIIVSNGKVEVFINGQKVEGVKSVSFSCSNEEVPVLMLELLAPGYRKEPGKK